MAMVASVSMAFVLVFCILLFHFVQQSRFTTATQLESIARSVREPLSAAILKADIPEAEAILSRIQPAGIVSRADVVLPNQFQALRMRFIPERPVPVTVTRLFELPVQISLPIYSLERPANPQPLAYLVLQADSYRMYKFVMSALATLVTAYLLLVLMLTVALTWCINRLMVRPLRRIARELNDLSQQERLGHQLTLRACTMTTRSACWCAAITATSRAWCASMMSCPSSRPASRSPSCRIKPFCWRCWSRRWPARRAPR
jgi:hypothetical protein